MTHNHTLYSLSNTFKLEEAQIIEIFALAEKEVSKEQTSQWLKREEEESFLTLKDTELSTFLNGFINLKRGKKDGPQPEPNAKLTKNIIFKKLKIALDLKNNDVLEVFKLAKQEIKESELTGYFRRPDHKNYRQCSDKTFGFFLKGLHLKYRPAEIKH